MPFILLPLAISTGTLGLLVGALLAEGCVLVPYWRSLPADRFFSMRQDFGPRLYRFFAPLTTAATLLTIISALILIVGLHPARFTVLSAAVLALVMVAFYGLYFKRANAAFASGVLSPGELADELKRWARWHWVRVGIGLAAFAASLMGLATSLRIS